MKLKMILDYVGDYKKGFVCEIDNIMCAPGECNSGVRVRVVNMGKQPAWFDLGWFIPDAITKRSFGRKADAIERKRK